MAKIIDKLGLGIFSALIIVFVLAIYFNAFYYLNASIADRVYEKQPSLKNIIIIKIDDESINKIGRWPWDRDVFSRLLEKTEDAKVVGIDVSFFERSVNDSSFEERLGKQKNVVLASEISYNALYKPIFNSSTGYVNLATNFDGVTRRVNFGLSDESAPFAFEIYRNGWNKNAVPDRGIKLINFADFSGSSVSAYEILQGINKIDFEDKIVLIGATAPDLHDNYFTPISEGIATGGVEIHASIVQNLILGDFLRSQSKWSIILLLFVFGIVGMFIISRFKIYHTMIVLVLFEILYFYTGFLAYSRYNYIIDFIFIPVSAIIFVGAGIGVNYIEERRHNKYITEAFGKYISKDLVQEIINKREKLELGGIKREITIFFSDIRGFTSISEKLSPEELVHFMNEYLTAMTNIIMKHMGTVDKFIGDAIMAIWNAPLIEKDHAKLACESAIEQIRTLKELKKSWISKKLPNVEIGCGINTGDAVIGNMGSEERFDYTAFGDSVNIASRLEGLTKYYGVNIIVSEFTHNLVKNDFKFRKLDKVKVKGKKVPIEVYELCEDYNKAFSMQFEKALKLYFERKFAIARKEFERATKEKKYDLACKLFIARCKEYTKNPPAQDWDGSYELMTK